MWTDLFADLTDPESPRRILYGALMLSVIAALLLAFSAVCGEQVRLAQARDASLQARRAAVSDCLEYAPKATRSGCLQLAMAPAAADNRWHANEPPVPHSSSPSCSRAPACGPAAGLHHDDP